MSKKVAIIILISFVIVSNILTNFFRHTYNAKLKNNSYNSKEQVHEDKEPPILELKDNKLILYQDDVLNYKALVLEAYDNVDGNLVSEVEHNEIDTSKIGIQELEYKVTDKAGNETRKQIKITILEKLSAVGE